MLKNQVPREQMWISFVSYTKMVRFQRKIFTLYARLMFWLNLRTSLYLLFVFLKKQIIKYKINTHIQIYCICKYDTDAYIQTCIFIGNVHSEQLSWQQNTVIVYQSMLLSAQMSTHTKQKLYTASDFEENGELKYI